MLRDRLTDMLASRYLVGEELPGGGMARVFAGHDPVLDRAVVIKVLPPERATAVAVERFRREARLLARLSHPHIVPVLEAGDGDGMLWFVMPRVAGEPLGTILARQPMSEAEVRRLGVELLDALEHAHTLGVVHRDIKPANILLHAGHALLADFGVALLRETSDDQLTEVGLAVGTLAYMSPEQRAGRSDRRSDLWSLGATLYEAATGRRWETASTPHRRPEVPDALRLALDTALRERPEDRWPDAAAFRQALLRAPPRGRGWLAYGGAAAVMLLALLTGSWWGSRSVASSTDMSSVPDLAIVTPSAAAPRTIEVATHAALMLKWLPMLRTLSQDEVNGSAPARVRVQVEGRVRGGDTILAIVAHDRQGALLADAEVPGDDLDGMVLGRAVARRIVQLVHPERLVEFDQLDRSNDDVQAWRSLWVGLTAFQEGRFADAEEALGEAIRRDSGFVVASWAQLLTRMWQREPFQQELEHLVAIAPTLPRPIDALVLAQHTSHVPERLARFDEIARRHPQYAPARLLLANELFHRGPLIGRSLAEGTAAFMAAAAEVPDLDRLTAWEQVLWGAIRTGDRAVARSAVDRIRRHPDALRREILLLAYDARFQPIAATGRRALLPFVVTSEHVDAVARYMRLGLLFDLPDEQARLATLVARRAPTRELRASAHVAQAITLLMQGRPDAAHLALAEAEAESPDPAAFRLQRAEWQLLLPLFGLDHATDHPGTVAPDGTEGSESRLAWAAMVTAFARGDTTHASRALASLRVRAAHDPLAAHLVSLGEAFRQAATGRYREAMVASAVILDDPGDAQALARGPLVRAVTKYRRGEWLLALGDTAGALAEWRWTENTDLQGWPAGAPQEGELDAALSPVVRVRQAELTCRLGDRRAGRTILARVDQLWRSAERSVREGGLLRAAREACR